MTQEICSLEGVTDAYHRLLLMEGIDFEGIWSGLTLIQRSVLKALAVEPTSSPYGKEFMARHRLSVGGTQRAMRALLSRDLVEQDGDKIHRLTDPVMEAWLRNA